MIRDSDKNRPSSRVSRRRFLGLVTGTAIGAGAGLILGSRRAAAQDVEPEPILPPVDCSKGGLGVMDVNWTGPFPYDVTVVTPVGRVEISRGEDNNRRYDLSGVKYNPAEPAPTIEFYLQHNQDASDPEKRRKLFQTVGTVICSTNP